jgi:predicted phosphodiesterase
MTALLSHATVPGSFGLLACLADTHGNVAALDAVLRSPEFAEADGVAFLGCTTTGPDPLGVLARCDEIEIPVFHLAGNGERALWQMAVAGRPTESEVDEWLVQQHGPRGVAMVRAWPQSWSVSVRGLGEVRLCHGSPRSDVELLTPGTPEDRIIAAMVDVPEQTLVHGHTHLQYDRLVAGRRVVGAGSVGLPYHDGTFGARWALLGPDVRLITTPYDLAEARRSVLASGYPGERYLRTLEHPPTPSEIIEDAEGKEFSD